MKKMAFLFLIVSSFASFASSKAYKVGVLYWSQTIEGQRVMREGIEQKTKELNKIAKVKGLSRIDLITRFAGDGVAGIKKQRAQFLELIKLKPDLIIVQPTDNAALSGPLNKANAASIPVIAFDQYIVGGKLLSLVTSNNYQAGYLDGEYLASLYPDDYLLKLILVEYPNVSSTIDRVDGFFDALKKGKQKFKVLKSYHAVHPKEGEKVAHRILKSFPHKNSIDAIFAINDGAGLALAKEIIKAKRDEIKIATVDGDPESVKLIEENKSIVIDSAQFCAEIGRQSILKAYEYLQGKKIPQKVLVPTFPVTRKTLKLYSGWTGKIPEPFVKPWNKKRKWDNSFKLKYEN